MNWIDLSVDVNLHVKLVFRDHVDARNVSKRCFVIRVDSLYFKPILKYFSVLHFIYFDFINIFYKLSTLPPYLINTIIQSQKNKLCLYYHSKIPVGLKQRFSQQKKHHNNRKKQTNIKMSQFIANTKEFQQMPIFTLPSKEIVMPKIKKYITTKSTNETYNYRRESKLLNSICQRLGKQEFQQIHNENARQIERKFQMLKHKLKPNIQRQSVQSILNADKKQDKLNIKEIVNMRPQKIQLDKKYGNKILLKMENFREAQEINTMKEKYRSWYDNEKNDTINSPIFKKMSYLLQRASKQKLLCDLALKNQVTLALPKPLKQKQSSSFSVSSSRNSSSYRKREIDWSSKRLKFSLFNPNVQV